MQVLASRIILAPSNFGASVRFYEDWIGLARFREWGSPGQRGVVYFLGGGYLELHEMGQGTGTGLSTRGVRLWLQVADAQAAFDELSARGVDVGSPPERKPWGLIEMGLRDPDGLDLVVVETPPDHPLRKRQ